MTPIDQTTLRHLMTWVTNQFGPYQPELTVAMVEQYETDPEFYDREGWWRCHDDMIASGNHTL